jgi:hypothetical protein
MLIKIIRSFHSKNLHADAIACVAAALHQPLDIGK